MFVLFESKLQKYGHPWMCVLLLMFMFNERIRVKDVRVQVEWMPEQTYGSWYAKALPKIKIEITKLVHFTIITLHINVGLFCKCMLGYVIH